MDQLYTTPIPYLIRPFTPGDEQRLCDLFHLVFGAPISTEQWQWKYLSSANNRPLSRLAFDALGNLVGHAGAIALRGQIHGKNIPIYQLADVMIHPQARSSFGNNNLSIRVLRELLTDLSKVHPRVLAYGFPGIRPFLLCERMRIYERIEQAHELVWTPSQRIHNPWWLSATNLEWTQVPLDKLWKQLQPNLPLSLVRDRDYLHWRYVNNPFHCYQILGLRQWKRYLGWAVINIKENKCKIIDILIAKNLLPSAIGAINTWAQTQSITTLHLWLPANWQDKLNFLSQTDTPVVTANMCWQMPWTAADLRADFYYTMGDVDIF